MNLSKAVKTRSKKQAEKIAAFIGADNALFGDLFTLFLSKDRTTVILASLPILKCLDKQPELISGHLPALLKNIENPVHVSVRRIGLRSLQFIEMPKKYHAKIIELCFSFLTNSSEPVAVKVFAMSVLGNLVRVYPELKNELKEIIETKLPFESAGYKSRAKKILMQLY